MRLQPQPVVNEFFAYEKNNVLIFSQHKQRKIKKGEVHVPRVLYFNVTKPPLCIYLIPFFCEISVSFLLGLTGIRPIYYK